jgi:hypothetical protein
MCGSTRVVSNIEFVAPLRRVRACVMDSVIHPQQPYGLPVNISLMSNHLIERGYVCHKVGKVRVCSSSSSSSS